MPIVHNNAARPLTIDRGVSLLPGTTRTVDDKMATALSRTAAYQVGQIRLYDSVQDAMAAGAPAPTGESMAEVMNYVPPAPPPLPKDLQDAPLDTLASLTEPKAIEKVNVENNLETLKRWANGETRQVVMNAISRRVGIVAQQGGPR